MAMQKKEKILGEAAGAAGAAGDGALGPGVAPVTLGLFLLPGARPGRRLTGAADDDPAAAGVVLFLFLLPRGRPQPRGATGEPRFKREPSVSAMWKRGKTRNPRWSKNMMRQRRNLIRVFTLAKRCFIYKHVLSGPRDKQGPSTYSTKELNFACSRR
jgi:hypothetical protein